MEEISIIYICYRPNVLKGVMLDFGAFVMSEELYYVEWSNMSNSQGLYWATDVAEKIMWSLRHSFADIAR